MPTLDKVLANLTTQLVAAIVTAMRAATVEDLQLLRTVMAADLPGNRRGRKPAGSRSNRRPGHRSSRLRWRRSRTLAVEEKQIRAALEQSHGNRTLAAQLLGISRRTLYNKLEVFGID